MPLPPDFHQTWREGNARMRTKAPASLIVAGYIFFLLGHLLRSQANQHLCRGNQPFCIRFASVVFCAASCRSWLWLRATMSSSRPSFNNSSGSLWTAKANSSTAAQVASKIQLQPRTISSQVRLCYKTFFSTISINFHSLALSYCAFIQYFPYNVL